MKRSPTAALLSLLMGAIAGPALAAKVSEVELMQAATELARQYDANLADESCRHGGALRLGWRAGVAGRCVSSNRVCRNRPASRWGPPPMPFQCGW